MPNKAANQSQPHKASGRIRAFRHQDVECQLEQSRKLLGLSGELAVFDPLQPHRLARALRLARRAARGGAQDYDPLRHLLLARYLRSTGLSGLNHAGNIREKSSNAREDV
jgi:hypothetical protein